jgi:hypothetical protein
MRLVVYALRFRGKARAEGVDGTVLTTATRAPGCTLSSRIGGDGLSGSLRPALGGEARLESELTFTGATTFQVAGTIAFGAHGHRLRFSTVGSGHLGPAAADGRRHGAAIWRVDGGEGQFAGASGLISSNFLVSDAGEVTDHLFGVVFVR